MQNEAYSHCSYCGSPFPAGLSWPRECPACGNISYRNPLPVCVVFVPIRDHGSLGVLAVRRAIPPHIGALALPGGFINYGETWQEGGAREVLEETGLVLKPEEIHEMRVRSANDGTLIIFAAAQPHSISDLPEFNLNSECSERVILTAPVPMAFSLHTEMVEWFFKDPSVLHWDAPNGQV